MFTSFEYTKEFEKILLTDNIEDALKNLVPNSVQDYFVRFITELKKCQKTKVLSDELKNLFTKIQKEKLNNQFVNDCERRYNLFSGSLILLDTFFEEDLTPLECLGKSISYMSQADIVYMAIGWESSRGCIIEHRAAQEYGKIIIYN